jgi:hypothetical protein
MSWSIVPRSSKSGSGWKSETADAPAPVLDAGTIAAATVVRSSRRTLPSLRRKSLRLDRRRPERAGAHSADPTMPAVTTTIRTHNAGSQ